MKIQEVEKKTGVTSYNIRYYEKEHLIMPKRSLNGYRDYSDEDVDRINRIKLLRLAGVPVKQIQEYFSDQKPVEEILQQTQEDLELEKRKIDNQLFLTRHLERYPELLNSSTDDWGTLLADESEFIDALECLKADEQRNAKIEKAKYWMFLMGIIIVGILVVSYGAMMYFEISGWFTAALYMGAIIYVLAITGISIYRNSK